MSFDTLAYVDELTKSGVDRKQAEAQARALKQIVMDDQATRQDLDKLADTLTIRFGSMLVIAVGAIGVLVKIF